MCDFGHNFSVPHLVILSEPLVDLGSLHHPRCLSPETKLPFYCGQRLRRTIDQ